jgi:hypothetical protein
MMSEPERRRALPPPLVAGLVLVIADFVFSLVVRVNAPQPTSGLLAIAALIGVGDWLVAYGLLVLADRHAGAARRGLQIAAASKGGLIALQLIGELSNGLGGPWWQDRALWLVIQDGMLAGASGSAIGLAVAVWRRHRALGIASLVVWIVSVSSGMVVGWLALDLGELTRILVPLGLSGLQLCVLIAIVRARAGERRDVDPARVGGDLRRTAKALRVAVVVMIAGVAALTLLAWCGAGDTHAETVVSATASGLAGAVFLWLGVTLLGAARDREAALAPYPLALAGALALECGRMLLAVVPKLSPSGLGSSEVADLALFVVPVAAVVGAAVLAWTIARFARRGGLDELRGRASLHAYGVIAALFVSPLVFVKLSEYHVAAGVLLAAGVCVVQVVLLARLCVAAATAVERRSALPEARVVRA